MSFHQSPCAGELSNGISMVDDYSSDFSVVSPPTMSSVYANGPILLNNDLHFDPASTTSDLSFTQMQEAVLALLQENAELKDVVQKDHATMKSQYEIMLHSKEQIETFMKRQLEMRTMAKTAVEKLKAENKDLNEKLKTVENLIRCEERALLDVHLTQLAAEADQFRSLIAEKNEELVRSQTQIQLLLVEKRDLAAINFDLQTKLSNDAQKSMDSSEGSDDHEFLIVERKQRSSFNKSSVVLQEGACQTSLLDKNDSAEAMQTQLLAGQERIQELEAELLQALSKLEEFKVQVSGQEEVIRRLAIKNTPPSSPSMSCQRLDSIEAELKVSDEMAKVVKSKMESYGRRCDELNQWLGDSNPAAAEAARVAAETEKAKLRAELENLRKALVDEQIQKVANKTVALDAQKALEMLDIEFRNYKKEFEERNLEQMSKGRQSEAYYTLQAKTFQEKQDELFGKFVACQDSLSKREAELKAALEKLDERKDDEETIAILRAQVELYKADFLAERESREKLHGEKENLQAMVKRLQLLVPGSKLDRPAKDIKHEKERHSRHEKRNSRHGQPPNLEDGREPAEDQQGAAGGVAAEPEVFVDEFPFKCPKCDIGFKEYLPLEGHVNGCLDKDNPFN